MIVNVKTNTKTETSPKKVAGLAIATSEGVELDGRRRFFALRDKWSNWIIGWITALIAFNILLTILVGVKYLDFKEYQWFITAVTIETFLQIVALGAIAVKYLFSDSK